MSRMRVLVIALLGCALLYDGSARTLPAPPPQHASRPALDAAAVARVVGSVNPTLSPRELDRIGAAVLRYSAKYELDPELVMAVLVVESGARPWARSPKGAMGLMQVMPRMMAPIGVAGNFNTIESNIEAGCYILSHNIRRLGEEDGISAYFWGSDIRNVVYLQRVQEARREVRARLRSS
jgi:soluble lytic murein transglycosylase-like protein